MKKTEFLTLLNEANKGKNTPQGLTTGNATTDYDRAHDKSFLGVYLYYNNTTHQSLIVYAQDKTKIQTELEKYKKWFDKWSP